MRPEDRYQQKFKRHTNQLSYLTIDLAELKNTLLELKHEFRFPVLLDIWGLDLDEHVLKEQGKFLIRYNLLSLETSERVVVQTFLKKKERLPGVGELWEGAIWYERELQEMLGVSFEVGTMHAPLLLPREMRSNPLLKKFKKHPFPILPEENGESASFESYDDYRYQELGSCHPAIRSQEGIGLWLKGEKVEEVFLDIGWHHQGLEKWCEEQPMSHIGPRIETLSYESGAAYHIGFLKCLEELLGLSIPDRAMAIRMIIQELSRVADHARNIALCALEGEQRMVFERAIALRDLIMTTLIRAKREAGGVILKVGGVGPKVQDKWFFHLRHIVETAKEMAQEIDLCLTGSQSFMKRMKVCAYTAPEALNWGFSGPTLRASGVNYDLRQNSPYYFYDQVPFKVPLGVDGTPYSRYLVRIEEVMQSLIIIEQVLENLPLGPLSTDFDIVTDLEGQLKNRGAQNHYSFTEVANGELGFFLDYQEGKNPYRMRIRSTSFPILQSFEKKMVNHFWDDAVVSFLSLNIIPEELDR